MDKVFTFTGLGEVIYLSRYFESSLHKMQLRLEAGDFDSGRHYPITIVDMTDPDEE